MTEGIVHVVGAGLAGLSTALRLAASRGVRVRVWEAAGHAGGRCRTFFDQRLGRWIDNGNHLVLTGNRSVQEYLILAGAADALCAASSATFPFVDLTSGARWSLQMNRGRIPWWIALPARRIPGTRLPDYLSAISLFRARDDETVAERIGDRGPLWRGFWEPLSLAVMNTTPDRASARLLARVMTETFSKGADAARPMFAPRGLGPALVDPAIARLAELGVELCFNRSLRGIVRANGRVEALEFPEGPEPVGPDDCVVLALPPSRLRPILPEIDLPEDSSAILNAHFLVAPSEVADAPRLIGVIGGRTQWIFTRGDVVSLTISAADRLGLIEADRDAMTRNLWDETRRVLALREKDHRAARIIIEKRATFDQSPTGVAKRPGAVTSLANLFLAGDATDTGLPATIEGAIRSGETAATLAAQGAKRAHEQNRLER